MKVRFYARGNALVSDYDALDQPRPLRRMVGRRYGQVPGQAGRFAFMPTGEAQELELRMELARDCAEGLLWPADQDTAEACSAMMYAGDRSRIKFDPEFGGEGVTQAPGTAPTDDKPGAHGQKDGD